ncbi:YaiO family outer membrane beta-barrel protein [Gilliamella sp. wkB308]|uniref:YaiO family outer membrane beta-barrel protein n=1 Tax=Gilliamella sp. wkB308 TaxID=3120263 RepID=UPI00080E4C54|nr:YaiO family outer membrane beta-barrel protein [Gilliamella apicola]OCG00695.1 hypothetical protein A9G10_04315 [Gilliamella apicola]
MSYKLVLMLSVFAYSSTTLANPIYGNNAIKAEQLLNESIEAKKTQNFKLAAQKLESALLLSPTNSDILVQLGFNYYALKNLDQAKQAFQKALVLAPNYVDAQYGLVSVVLAQNIDNPSEAELLLNHYLKQSPNDTQLLTLKKTITDIKKSIHYWTLNVAGTHSHLTKSYADWNEMEFALSYKLSKTSTITGHVAQSHRFNMNDQRIGTTFWHTLNDRAYGYLSGFTATSKKFFARYTLASGADYVLLPSTNDYLNSLHITLDLKFDHYNDGNIKSITPGIEQYFLNDRLSIAGKWYNTYDQDNNHTNGFLIKLTASPTEKWHLFIGYSNAQETSDRSNRYNHSLIKAKAHFVGLTYDISNRFSLQFNYTAEGRKDTNRNRNLYNKKTVGCGIKWTF